MAVLTRDEFFDSVHKRVGTDSSEEAMTFIENMTDTFMDMEKRATGDGEDWKRKYEELDASWKKKYKERFFSGGAVYMPNSTSKVDDPYVDNRSETITVSDLFKKKG